MTPDPHEPAAHEPTAPHSRPRRTTRLLLLAAVAVVVASAAYNLLLSRSLGTREVLVYGQNRWAPGLPASVRVVVLQRGGHRPVAGAPVRIVLVRQKAEYVDLAQGRTNQAGTLDTTFTVPEGEGPARLLVVTEDQLQVDRPILLVPAYRIYLTTDRPAYRTGQQIRLHLWVRRAGTGQPARAHTVSLRLFAPDGTLVAARPLQTDEQGAATTPIALAPGAPPGTYRVKVTVGPSSAQVALPVVAGPEPPFPVWLSGVTRTAVPGGLVRGRVRATDALGSPLRRASARVWLEAPNGRPVSWTSGPLDEQGELSFGLPAPRAESAVSLRLQARVTDFRLRSARAMLAVAVTPHPIQVTAVPEAGILVPGVQNRVYLLARYPDGTPARAALRYTVGGRSGTIRTSPLGVAAVSCTPARDGIDLAVSATDTAGYTGALEARLPALSRSAAEWALRDRYRALTGRPGGPTPPPVLLRPDRGIYPPGGTIRLEAFSPGAEGPLYVDGFADGQTAFTATLILRDGRGTLQVRLPDALTGTLWLRAYTLGPWGDAARCIRAVFVRPHPSAHLSLQLGRALYQPAQTGHLTLRASEPASAAVTIFRSPGPATPPPVVGPAALPLPPGASASAAQPSATGEEQQQAALATLASLLPPDGWSLYEDVFARKQTQLQQHRAKSWTWLRWAVLALLGGIWLLALITRALFPPQAGPSAEAQGPTRNAASPLHFVAAALTVALAATFLFRLSRAPAPQSISAGTRIQMDLQREREAAARRATRQMPGLPPPLPPSVPVPQVALWQTSLRTNEEGRATTLFTAPSEPGRWHVAAAGVTASGALAHHVAPLHVGAEVLAELDSPPLARTGDVLGVALRIRNPLGVPQTIVSKVMVGPGLFLAGEPVRTDELPGGAAAVRHLQIRVGNRVGETALTVAITGRRHSVAIRRTLQVQDAHREHAATYAGWVTEPATHRIELRGAVREAVLSIQRSPAEVAAARLLELQRQPVAGAMDHAAILDIARMALPAGPTARALAVDALDRHLQELIAFRNPDGSFAAFLGEGPDLPATAYAAAVLELLRSALPGAGPLARQARIWIRSQQRADGTWPREIHGGRLAAAFTAWCLGPGDPATHRARARYRARALASEDACVLALGALGFGDAPANGTQDAPGRPATFSDRLATLALGGPEARRWVSRSPTLQGLEGSASAPETTALALLALAGNARHQALVREAVRFIAAVRQPGGSWGSPFATALALRALAAALPQDGLSSTAIVELDGNPVGRLTPQAATLDLQPHLTPGVHAIRIRSEERRALLYELTLRGTGVPQPERPGSPEVWATYAYPAGDGNEAVEFMARIRPGNTGVLCLEVPVPAGFRPVRDDLDELVARGDAVATHLDAGRVLLFLRASERGEPHRVSFRLAAPPAGEAIAPPPVAYPAANPGACASGRAVRLVVESAQ